MTQNSKPNHHPTFEWIRSQPIAALNITIEEYRHKTTGAVHYHLAAESDENVFLVALRTVPTDSTGVAHILEHTVLCGSERYPVRDPFFLMIRRSLNTFMNAFTSSDWTAYPFASQNKKDFNNLLDVYLDAVFFARLDPLDFVQEGHRVEFAERDNTDSELVFKGVVFNEMKGAMSSVPSTLWHTLCKHLYPSTTYHYNSGGEPENIPDLSYQQLQDFYKLHYHPSNAVFMTYGNIAATEHQARFEDRALSYFVKLEQTISVPQEQRYQQPQRVAENYAFNDEQAIDNKAHIVIGWLLGDSTNLQDRLRAHLLAGVLLNNSASPLQKLLETTKLGSAPSPLCGLEDSMREMVFICGIEGSTADAVDALEQQVLATLTTFAQQGVPQQQVEAVLHQIELQQREISGDSYPFGLQLILNALGTAIHRGDAIAALDLEPALDQLRQDIADPNFIKSLARRLLLDNPHRVTLLMTPDATLDAKRLAEEKARLADMKTSLSNDEQNAIVNQAQALEQRQQQQDDESILPKVGLDDIPADIRTIDKQSSALNNGMPLHTYCRGTNGLVYQELFIPLPQLTAEQIALLPYYGNSLTELGVGEHDYLATQMRQSNVCGSIYAYTAFRAVADDPQNNRCYLVLGSNALARNQQAQAELIHDTLHAVHFDEHPRLHELVNQQRAAREQAITQNGHTLAMSAASSGMSAVARLGHELSGLAAIRDIRALDQQLQRDTAPYAEQLAALHQQILSAPKHYLLIAEQQNLSPCHKILNELWQEQQPAIGKLDLAPLRTTVKQLWVTNTQVNFCAKSYPTVPATHADAPVLAVLGGFLRNGFLHRVIREQGGAYGGGAGQDSGIAAFRFFSYRDPRIEATLADFDRAIDWLLTTRHEDEKLEQAILGVIGSLDKPGSPAGEAKQLFYRELAGHTPERRRQFRQQVLATTIDDLKRVARDYLKPELASTAIITNQTTRQKLDGLIERETLDVFVL